MANVGAKNVGRVSIRVLPDTTKLRDDLKKAFARIERTMSITIPVDVELDRAKNAVKRFVVDEEKKSITLDATVDTAVASARIAVAARPRIVPLSLEVTKSSLARVGSVIAGLSGARLIGDYVKRLTTNLAELDRALPKMAGASLGIANIVSVLLSSVGGLLTVGAGIAQTAGAALALPGILAGAAVGIGVLAIALGSAKDELADLAPAWRTIRDLVRDNFWSRAREPIRDLVNGLLPQMESGLGRTATALGNWAAAVSRGFQDALGGGVLEGMIDRLNESIDIAAGGTGAFARAVAILGTVGASYLPRLATWVSNLATGFESWLSRMDGEDRLTGFIDAGIVALQQLGSIVGYTSGILQGLFTAAETAGGGGLATLADALYVISGIVNSPQFQTTLSTIFAGAADGAAGLTTALGPIGDLLTVLAPTIASVLGGLGELAGLIGTRLAEALASPVFVAGMNAFFDGIMAGVEALLPSVPALVEAFAAVATFAGNLAAQLGPVLGEAIQALVPVLLEVLTALTPLIPILGEALIEALPALGESFVQLVLAITPLLPMLAQMVVAMLPQLVLMLQLATPLLQLLLQPTPVMQFVMAILQLAGGLSQMAQQVFGAVGATQAIANALNGQFGPAVQAVISVVQGMKGAVQDAFSGLGGIVRSAINNVIDTVNGAIGGINAVTVAVGLGSIGKLPRLAMGADILPTPGGTAVILGEGGRRESVVDYGNVNRLISEVTGRLTGSAVGGGTGVQVMGDVYGATPRQIVDLLDKRKKMAQAAAGGKVTPS